MELKLFCIQCQDTRTHCPTSFGSSPSLSGAVCRCDQPWKGAVTHTRLNLCYPTLWMITMLIYFVSQLSNCCHRVLVSHTSIPSMLQCFQETAAPGNWFLMTMSPALAMVQLSECPRLQWNSTAPEWMERNIMRLLSLRIAGMDSLGFVQHHLLSTHDREECHMRKSCFLLHFLMLKATKICLLYPERSLSSPPLQETPSMRSPPKPPADTQREGDEKQSPTMMPLADIASWKEQALHY